MGTGPIDNNSRIEGSFNFGAKQHVDMNALVKEASNLGMNSPLESSSPNISNTPMEGGSTLVAIATAADKGLNLVADLHIAKQFNQAINHSSG